MDFVSLATSIAFQRQSQTILLIFFFITGNSNELKRSKFKPEYAEKMNFYLNLLEEFVKETDKNPSNWDYFVQRSEVILEK